MLIGRPVVVCVRNVFGVTVNRLLDRFCPIFASEVLPIHPLEFLSDFVPCRQLRRSETFFPSPFPWRDFDFYYYVIAAERVSCVLPRRREWALNLR